MPQLTVAELEESLPQELAGGTPIVANETSRVDTPGATASQNAVRNFFCLVVQQVLQRIGWIFKTETLIMPAFMDYIGGGPVLRSCLPVLNRLGFSVPQVLFARRLKVLPKKKWVVAIGSLVASLPFAALSIIWARGWWQQPDGTATAWMPYLFLALYGMFFVTVGITQLAAHSLQGKLIRANLRGRLFATTVLVGAPTSILAAWMWLPQWLETPTTGFAWIFAMPALAFALGTLAVGSTVEETDAYVEKITPLRQRFVNAWHTFGENANFARLAVVAVLFSATFIMFPHYQTLGRIEGTVPLGILMKWIFVQHTAVAVFSLIVGPIADWLGNRAALRLTLLGATLAPLTAVVLAQLPPELSRQWYWLIYVPIGFTPVTIRILINYTLEAAPAEEHPRYVSAMGMCLALPAIIGSVPVGLLIRYVGYTPLFAVGSAVLALASLQTYRLAEPRHEKE